MIHSMNKIHRIVFQWITFATIMFSYHIMYDPVIKSIQTSLLTSTLYIVIMSFLPNEYYSKDSLLKK